MTGDGRRAAAYAALLTVTAIWGLTFVLIKDVTDRWSGHQFTFNAIRFWIATLAFAPFLVCAKPIAGAQPRLGAGVFAGLALFGGYALQTAGIGLTTPSIAGFLTGLCIVFVPIGAALLGRPVSRHALAGLAIALPGMVLMSLDPKELRIGVGELLVVGCAISFAVQILVVDRHARNVDPIRFTALQCLVTAVAKTLVSVTVELPRGGLPTLDAGVVGAALFCGLFATTLAFAVQTAVQRSIPATGVAVVFATEPLFAATASWALRGEVLTWQILVGGAAILTGILWTELGPRLRAVRAQSR